MGLPFVLLSERYIAALSAAIYIIILNVHCVVEGSERREAFYNLIKY
jgi:hypothetical protein